MEMLTTGAVAERLGCTRKRAWRLMRTGAVPAEWFGGRIVSPRAAFEAWHAAQVKAALAKKTKTPAKGAHYAA
jgi:predicted DNA-binding transcriptional regulator AlpA